MKFIDYLGGISAMVSKTVVAPFDRIKILFIVCIEY
jgi:hypothetical protein